jgi:hypothetical protein
MPGGDEWSPGGGVKFKLFPKEMQTASQPKELSFLQLEGQSAQQSYGTERFLLHLGGDYGRIGIASPVLIHLSLIFHTMFEQEALAFPLSLPT